MKKSFIILVFLLVCALTIAGCSSAASTTAQPLPSTAQQVPTTQSLPPAASTAVATTTAAKPAPSPKRGGILKYGTLTRAMVSLGYPPTMSGQWDGMQTPACLETLFRYDENMKLIPWLATDWKANAGDKTITLTLRKGVKFQDGSDFNAATAKWNLDQYRATQKAELANVKSIDVVDDYTIRLNLSPFDNVIISNLTGDPGRMISQKAFETNGQAWCEKNPVGTGPFKFLSWEKDVAIKFTRFDQYWQTGKPYLEGFQIIYFADETVAGMALQNGDIDEVTINLKAAKQMVDSGKYKLATIAVGQEPFLAGDGIHPDSPFANIKVRQAVSYAINNAEISQSLGLGYWTPLNQWAVPGTDGYNPGVVGYPYNPAKSKQLLQEAGYPNLKTTLYFLALGDMVTWYTSIQGYLNKAGFDITLEPCQRAKYETMATGGGWNNGLIGVQVDAKTDVLVSMYPLLTPNSIKFPSMIRPPEYADLFAKCVSASTAESKAALVKDLMKMGTDTYCVGTWLWSTSNSATKALYVQDDFMGATIGQYISPDAWLNK
jgi:peptide/nickel transport system substrate-binding protein